MSEPRRLLVVFGTRPEAIKLAPVLLAAYAQPERFVVRALCTGQHREMVDQVLDLFALRTDVDLGIMRPGQDLVHVTTACLRGIHDDLAIWRPHHVLVQGDTTTAFAGALAAFYHRVPVSHIEAGLRTGDRYQPFPEEINRRMISPLADWHFAPTTTARDHLLAEGVPTMRVHVTGNTGIDALFLALAKCDRRPGPAPADGHVLVTAHRRENHGAGLNNLCMALLRLLVLHPTLRILMPVHPSPSVQSMVLPMLSNHPRINLCAPLGYLDFVQAMADARVILTDSGGVQEEAPALGRPVLVMRNTTERPEAIQAGTAKLIGTNPDIIVSEVHRLLIDPVAYAAMAQVASPFGDGQASARILDVLAGDGNR